MLEGKFVAFRQLSLDLQMGFPSPHDIFQGSGAGTGESALTVGGKTFT